MFLYLSDPDGIYMGEMSSCFGHPLGLEMVSLERMEQWIFVGFTLCHFVVDGGQKEAGEYRIWALLLQGMWVMKIVRYHTMPYYIVLYYLPYHIICVLIYFPVRDEVLWVHEELSLLFKFLKGQKEEKKAVGKKAVDLKNFFATALKSAPMYHRERRLYLTELLKHYYSFLKECPGLLGPRIVHIVQLLHLCQYEVHWLLR